MKRIFMLVFIALSCWPFYQIILSQNGIIEGYRVAEEKKLLLQYKGLLEKEKTELNDYIDYIRNNPEAKVYLANKLGYFFSKDLNLVKINRDSNDTSKFSDIQKRNLETEMLWNDLQKHSQTDKTIRRIRSWTIILFVLVFGFFAVITLLGSNVNNFRSETGSRGRAKINRVPNNYEDEADFRRGVEENRDDR
jgi:hypothetical protein